MNRIIESLKKEEFEEAGEELSELWKMDLTLFYFLSFYFLLLFFIYFIFKFHFYILDLGEGVWCDVMLHVTGLSHWLQPQVTKSHDREKVIEDSEINDVI